MCDHVKVDGTRCRRKAYCWQHQTWLSRAYRVAVTVAITGGAAVLYGILANILTPQVTKLPDLVGKTFFNPPEARAVSYLPEKLSNPLANSASVTGVSLSLPMQENLTTQDSVQTLIQLGVPASPGLIVPSSTDGLPTLGAGPAGNSFEPAILSNLLGNSATVTGASFSLPLNENLSTQDNLVALVHQNSWAGAGLVVPASTEAPQTLGVGPAVLSFQPATVSYALENPVTASGANLSLSSQENSLTQGAVGRWIHLDMPASTGLVVAAGTGALPTLGVGPTGNSFQPATISNTLANSATVMDASFLLPQQQNPLTQDSAEVLTNFGVSASTSRIVLSNSLAIPNLEVSCAVAPSGASQ